MSAFCKSSFLRASSWAAINLCTLVAVQPSLAQTVPGNEARMDVVTVTTQKREEAITDVPIAITAFQADDLETLRATSLEDIATLAPNTNYKNQSPAAPSISIRGITSDESGAGSESAVSTYLDGVDISRREGSQMAIYDLERVEIVRGPQGTLFGTASQIGGLNIITQKPTDEYGGYLTASLGNFDYRRLEGAYNLPVSDKVALRVSGLYEAREGYIRNRGAANGDSADYMGLDKSAARAILRLEPTSDLTIDLIGYYEHNDPSGTQFTSFTVPAPDLQLVDFTRDTFQVPRRPSQLTREIGGAIALAEYNFSDDLSLNSISGYREYNYQQYFDLDGSFVPLIDADIDNDTFSLYQEFRLNFSAGDRFRGFTGVSYVHEKVDEEIGLTFSESIFAVLQSGVLVLPNGQPNRLNLPASLAAFGVSLDENRREFRRQVASKNDQSVFVDLSYDVTDRFSLNGGIRYVENNRRFASNHPAQGQSGLVRLGVYSAVSAGVAANFTAIDQTFSPTNPAHPLFGAYIGALQGALPGAYAAAPKNIVFRTTNGVLTGEKSFNGVLPRASAEYALSDEMNLYAGIAKGQRSGFLQADGAGAVSPVDPEQLWNYEVGLKGAFDRFRFETAAFLYEWTDFQTVELIDPNNPTLGTRSVNAGSASAIGAEGSIETDVNDWLSIFANLSYLDASYDEFISSEGDFSGNRFRIAPEWQASAGASGSWKLGGPLSGFYAVRASYQSSVFFDNSNAAPQQDDAYTIVSANVGIRNDAGWSARVFADNLLDEDYLIDAGNSGASFGTPTAIAAPPRMYGVEVGFKF